MNNETPDTTTEETTPVVEENKDLSVNEETTEVENEAPKQDEEKVITVESLGAELFNQLEETKNEVQRLQNENQALLIQLDRIFKSGSAVVSNGEGDNNIGNNSSRGTSAENYQEPLSIEELGKLIR